MADTPELKVHEIKTWPEYFRYVSSGLKRFELRKDDRGYAVGDTLRLFEWEPTEGRHTGRVSEWTITYVLRDAEVWGLKPGFVILSLASPTPPGEVREKVARIIDQAAFSAEPEMQPTADMRQAVVQRRNHARAQADAILALLSSSPAESGLRGGGGER